MTPPEPAELAALAEALAKEMGATVYGSADRVFAALAARGYALRAAAPRPETATNATRTIVSSLVAATPEGLDVERLAEALFQIHHIHPWRWWDGSDVFGTSVEFAAEIAYQYARLVAAAPEPAPELEGLTGDLCWTCGKHCGHIGAAPGDEALRTALERLVRDVEAYASSRALADLYTALQALQAARALAESRPADG